ncbi:hypothetical protein FACS1894163_04870 [Spirochaetia bacterium]|nr:hypothetical protein FACS1894163_04870 [Spirochaetia bacterium]
MRISIPGNDKGNAVLLSLVFILIFSMVFLSLGSYLMALNKNVHKYREQVFSEIRETNQEVLNTYDIN